MVPWSITPLAQSSNLTVQIIKKLGFFAEKNHIFLRHLIVDGQLGWTDFLTVVDTMATKIADADVF